MALGNLVEIKVRGVNLFLPALVDQQDSVQNFSFEAMITNRVHRNGEGVAQSDVKAFLWWTLAAQKGSSKAKTFIRETRGVIRKHHAAEARQLAQICDQSSYQHCKW